MLKIVFCISELIKSLDNGWVIIEEMKEGNTWLLMKG
jgi:hypothetical protein